MKTAIGYVRVSTEEQGASGLGLEAQSDAIRKAAKRLGAELVSIHEDSGISGAASLAKRPGLLSALAELRRGAVLVVAKRDRLGRDVVNVALTERLVERKGARVLSAAGEGTDSDDPTGRLMRRIVDCFAEYERLVIRARTRAALQAKRRRGERCGGSVPFGWTDDAGRWIPVPAEQAIIADVVAQHAAGASYVDIAAALNARGLRTKQGAAWKRTHVFRVLRGARQAEAAA